LEIYVSQIKTEYLRNIPVTFTICKALVKCPAESERKNLIYERHTKISGHKGITKTYIQQT